MKWKFVSLAMLFVAPWEFEARAQSTDAKVIGRAIDQASGAPLGGVVVEVRKGDSFVARGESDRDGYFALPAVAPGLYQLKGTHDGYYPLVSSLELKPRDELRLTLTLIAVAAVKESVEVSAVAPAIDPQRTDPVCAAPECAWRAALSILSVALDRGLVITWPVWS